MKPVRIYPVPVGIDMCYLLCSDRSKVLIDGGGFGRNNGKAFMRAINRIGIDPLEIDLIIVTHAHWDHISALDYIQRVTQARVAAHVNARVAIEAGAPRWPKGVTGYGKIMSLLASWLINPRVPPVVVDILIEDELDLSPYGIYGRVVHTPGHSAGSVSVLLESGDAFVGDMAMQGWYLRWKPGLPILADDKQALLQSWRKILPEVQTVYPAHGKPFPRVVIERELAYGENT